MKISRAGGGERSRGKPRGEERKREGGGEAEKKGVGRRERETVETPHVFVDCAANSSPVNDLITFVT